MSAMSAGKIFTANEFDSVEEAMEQASCFMSAAKASAYAVADRVSDDGAYSVAYLVDMAKAVVDAAVSALAAEKRKGGAQ